MIGRRNYQDRANPNEQFPIKTLSSYADTKNHTEKGFRSNKRIATPWGGGGGRREPWERG